ncbi:unnamed protein product, partial [Heterosigma akashiwo]
HRREEQVHVCQPYSSLQMKWTKSIVGWALLAVSICDEGWLVASFSESYGQVARVQLRKHVAATTNCQQRKLVPPAIMSSTPETDDSCTQIKIPRNPKRRLLPRLQGSMNEHDRDIRDITLP